MSDIVLNENSTETEIISKKNNNNNINSRIENKVCPCVLFNNKSCNDACESICVQSDSNSRSNEIEIDSDIENSTPVLNTPTLSTFDDNTSNSSLESETDSNRHLNMNLAISNNDTDPTTILSNVISTLNQSVPAVTIAKINNSQQPVPVILNTSNSNPTRNAGMNVTTTGVGVLNIGDQINGTHVNVIYCREPKNPTVVLNSNGNGM